MTGHDLYTDVSYELARKLTLRYSSSFGLASRFFPRSIRRHIYAVYGMVRVADEIVDTYTGADKSVLLDAFETDVTNALHTGYSTNPVIQAFAETAVRYSIGTDLVRPFFISMRMDLNAASFTAEQYRTYIYGSAEVIGLMCLRIFCGGNNDQYAALAPGAERLGSAYQKVNFLRDFGEDYRERHRIYFPGVTIEGWTDEMKDEIATDIEKDFAAAHRSIKALPVAARTSVYLSYLYYRSLLAQLRRMGAKTILSQRAHVPTLMKLGLLILAPVGARFQ